MHRWKFWLVTAAVAVAVAGCKHTCCKSAAPPCYSCTPPAGAPIIQPQPSIQAPVPISPARPPEVLTPAPGAAPGAPPLNSTPSSYPPVAQGGAPAVHLLQPELSESVQQAAASEPAVTENKSAAQPMPSAPLPVGIPGFAPAISDRVANGRKPALEGLDWLKTNNYRGALMLRAPGESDAADRRQFEARNLAFVSLEVALVSLDRSVVDQFNQIVADSSKQPLFVYDTDGSMTGPLWYLYFRRVEKLDDDAARAKAERLGLKLGDRDQRLGWLAVQDFLAKNP
jgi:hypothetical protein